MLVCIHYGDACQLDVEELIDGMQGPLDAEIILQLHHQLLAHECLEERVKQLEVYGCVCVSECVCV